MFFDAVKCFPFFVSLLEPEKSLMKSKIALLMNAVYNRLLLADSRSTPTSGTFFCEDFKKSSCQLMAKECALCTG